MSYVYLVCVYGWMLMCHAVYVEVKEQFVSVLSVLPLCMFHELKAGGQA